MSGVDVGDSPLTVKEHRAFIRRLNVDLAAAAASMAPSEARTVVDLYYQVQEFRKASKNQVLAGKLSGGREPNTLLTFVGAEFRALETLCKKAMDVFTDQHEVTKWAKSVVGVGPVLAGGIFSQINMDKAPTAGSIWRFAGLDPTIKWFASEEAQKFVRDQRGSRKLTPDVAREIAVAAGKNPDAVLRFATTNAKGEERKLTSKNLGSALAKKPFNGRLKTMLWKFADCQVKFKNKDGSFYGPLMVDYKNELIRKNLAGEFKEAAAASLARLKDRSTPTYKANSEGRLSDGHIEARTKRWVAKLFASHWHEVAHQEYFGRPAPKPYVIEHLGHAHIISPPNNPFGQAA
jgi:hypothetical protein